MDDITITAPPNVVRQVAADALDILETWGFAPNPEKSKLLCKDISAVQPQLIMIGDAANGARLARTNQFEVCGDDKSFIVLGGNITSNYQAYNARQSDRNQRFFNCIKSVHLHTQIAFTIARLCGLPRCKFYASVTPPEHSMAVLTKFQNDLIKYMEYLFGFTIPEIPLHQQFGMGLPDYVSKAEALFLASKNAALFNTRPTQVSLVTGLGTDPEADFGPVWTEHLLAQHQADWMFYWPRGAQQHLTSAEFCLALSIRCRAITDFQRASIKHLSCNCRTGSRQLEDVIQHAIVCPRNHYTPALRHEKVKHAIANCLRQFGFSVTVEPNYFVYEGSQIMRRPDIAVHLEGYEDVVTDLVIVKQEGQLGVNAAKAAEEKNKIHKSAVSRAGAKFFPFAMEVHGHRDKSCTQFFDALNQHIQPHEKWRFRNHFFTTVSAALAHTRVRAILSTCQLFDHT